MDHHIVDDPCRRHDQPPGEIERPLMAAGTPAGPGAVDFDRFIGQTGQSGIIFDPLAYMFQRLLFQRSFFFISKGYGTAGPLAEKCLLLVDPALFLGDQSVYFTGRHPIRRAHDQTGVLRYRQADAPAAAADQLVNFNG